MISVQDLPAKEQKLEVATAFLHQPLVIPGATTSEKTLHDKKIKGIKMYWSPTLHGLLIEVKGESVVVPGANIVNVIFKKD